MRGGRASAGSLHTALPRALAAGHWRVPKRFNFTRDVVEILGEDPKRQALRFVGNDGVIEPWTFLQLARGAARWAAILRMHRVGPGDRVLVLEGASPGWIEIMLGAVKLGAVSVPCAPTLPAAALGIRIAASRPKLIVAARSAEDELVRVRHGTPVVFLDDARRHAHRLPSEDRTHKTSSHDPAFIVSTSGRTNGPRGVVHSHSSTFAARVHAEHWLDAGLGDLVWCTAPTDSAQAFWSTLFGPWSRGAEVVLHDGAMDPVEQLETLRRLGVSVLCQTPTEYRVLAESGQLSHFRWARPRRLVSTGEMLPRDLIGVFEEEWGLTIHDGYGQAETGVIVGHDVRTGYRPGSIGRPLPGYEVAVIDGKGNQLPPNHVGALALGGHPPSLFVGYWDAPDESNAAFRGDWYVTGDLAVRDEDGFLWLRGRTAGFERIRH
jgi:acyl-coenzyme A synthetase/AMP-(fatty) acid ligase